MPSQTTASVNRSPYDTAFFAYRRALRLDQPAAHHARALARFEKTSVNQEMLFAAAAVEALLSVDNSRTLAENMTRYVNAPPEANPAKFFTDNAFSDELPEIRVEPGDLTEQVNAAEAALMSAEVRLFQHAGRLVRLGWVAAGDTETMRIVPVDEIHLSELIGRHSRWFKRDVRSRGYVPCSPPREVAATYLARGGLEWRFPRLAAVIEAATLRRDGSILSQPGYDAETELFLAPGECDASPSRQSQAAAGEALETLDELLGEFPFVADADRAVALAAILTASIRRALPTAPLFAFTAPAPGTGKSLLVDVIAMIGTGKPAPGFTWTGDTAEDRKALDAALLEGASLISLDNVTAPLGGDRLNQLLTQSAARVRVLGESKTVEVSCGALVIANGNNLAVAADLTRRTMLCRLDAKVERPELRTFDDDPVKLLLADRGRYLSAALTILRAYDQAGRPGQPTPLGSFEVWSGWVRGALLWLGCADPVETQEAARDVDPRGAELSAVLGLWNEHLGDRHLTSAEIIGAAIQHSEFREALLAVAGAAGAINTHRLGKWLHANKGNLVAGLTIDAAGKTRTGVVTWRLAGARSRCEVIPFEVAAE